MQSPKRSSTLDRSMLLMAACLVTGTLGSQETHRLALGTAEAPRGSQTTVPLTLSSTAQVQGLVAVFQWDETELAGESLAPGSAIADADVVVTRVEASYMVLGVVMDADGEGLEILPPGENLPIADAGFRCLGAGDGDTSIEFTPDGMGFSAVDGGPALDNQVTVGGLSIGREEGLELGAGGFRCLEAPRVSFRLADGAADPSTGCGVIEAVMSHPLDPVEGYELSIAHPEGLAFQAITIEGTAASANGADFSQADILAGGGTLGVVMDLVEPFEGNVIPASEASVIARLSICCAGGLSAEPVDHTVSFQDGLGSPPKQNTAVVGGEAILPALENGTFTCPAASGEVCDDDADNDGDGLADCDDPDCASACELANQTVTCGSRELAPDGIPFTAEGQVGGTTEVSFFYKSPDIPGPGQEDQVQGLSLAICYPCELQCQEGSFDVTGTIVEAVGAEFISHQCDNDGADGDGCELIIGILVDALPPFDAATLPPTESFLRIGSMDFAVSQDPSVCGRCLPVEFCDGINGRGVVPIRNLASVANSSRPLRVMSCEVCVEGPEVFHRGDCNFSGTRPFAVDISDAAAVISSLFLDGILHFEAPCLDACDSNDDGRLDLADAMNVLNFLFRFGAFPPAPGPGFDRDGALFGPGVDPTLDDLDCAAGSACQV